MARPLPAFSLAQFSITHILTAGLMLAGCSGELEGGAFGGKSHVGGQTASGASAGLEDGSGGDTAGGGGSPGGTPVEGNGAIDFVSDVYGQSTGWGAEDANGATGSGGASAAPPTGDSGDEAARAISEADIIRVQGDTLYALSRYRGLAIIDLSVPSALRIIGSHRSTAIPFEMYIEDGTAYIMYNDYSRRERDEESGYYTWKSSSRMQALDVSNPESPAERGHLDLPGSISDSRKVGDVIYVVTHQRDYCWECDAVANTRISSFDVSDPAVFNPVDQERFENQDETWGTRHVSVSQDRIYVSGYTWSSDGSPRAGTIQVVDISDPAGAINPGAVVEVAGQVDNRWQVDEFDGVLRVISQPDSWTSSSVPVVETFVIESSLELTPLASLPMVLPRPEDLKSVRFDGERAFAVTFERTDPLFTFDMSDPAHPVQLGELEIPGFLYHMEPRGDRLYALGFDESFDGGALHVSIFDVSDLSNPTMLDRVNFGGVWGGFAEDQDRIHKVFNLALDEELILLPFSGSLYDAETCYHEWGSGIQLIDARGDDLALRGVVPQVGEARRALLHDGLLFGISDNAIQAFDISDRDNPQRIDRLDVAVNVSKTKALGDSLLRFGQVWWTGEVQLDVVALDNAEAAESDALLELNGLSAIRDRSCPEENGEYQYSRSDFTGEVFVSGGHAFVPRESEESAWSDDSWYQRSTMFVTVVALSGEAPHVVGEVALEPTSRDENDTEPTYFVGVIQTTNALLVGRRKGSSRYHPGTGEQSETSFLYDVIDTRSGAEARVVSRIEVPDSMAMGGWGDGVYGCVIDAPWGWYGSGRGTAAVSGNIVASQHQEPLDDDSGRVRYYLDRIDVSDPANPLFLEPVNVPGKVIHYDHERGLLITIEDVPVPLSAITSSGECSDYGQGATWQYDRAALIASDYDYTTTPATCVRWERRLNSLVLEDGVARRVSTHDLDAEQEDGTSRTSRGIAVSDSRIFYGDFAYGENSWSLRDGRITALGYAADGQLTTLGSTAVDVDYWGTLVARGNRAFISSYGILEVVTSPDGEPPTRSEYELRGSSCGVGALEVVGDVALCAGYQYGVQRIELE